jgi:hypothetical protein
MHVNIMPTFVSTEDTVQMSAPLSACGKQVQRLDAGVEAKRTEILISVELHMNIVDSNDSGNAGAAPVSSPFQCRDRAHQIPMTKRKMTPSFCLTGIWMPHKN